MTRDGDLALLEEALGGGDQARHRQRHLYERDLLVALGPQQDKVVSAPAMTRVCDLALLEGGAWWRRPGEAPPASPL
jgi:hypothetical protein